MPASLAVTHDQLRTLVDDYPDTDVVFWELPVTMNDGTLDVWLMDEHSQGTEHHTLILEADGTVISDVVVPDL